MNTDRIFAELADMTLNVYIDIYFYIDVEVGVIENKKVQPGIEKD